MMQQMQTLWDQKSIIELKLHAILAASVQVGLQKAQLMPVGKKVPGLLTLSPSLLSKNDSHTKSHAERSL